MSQKFNSDAGHTHLHQYFNVTVNNVIERGLNDKNLCNEGNLTKEWEKYLPFTEEIKSCTNVVTEELMLELNKIVETEVNDLESLLKLLPVHGAELTIWPSQEKVTFQTFDDLYNDATSSIDASLIQERKKDKYTHSKKLISLMLT